MKCEITESTDVEIIQLPGKKAMALKALMCPVFRDVLLHTWVVTSVYLPSYQLEAVWPVCSDL